MIKQEFVDNLNEFALKKGQELLEAAKRELSKDKRYNSGELLRSLQLDIVNGTTEEPPMIYVRFAKQGAYMGVRKMEWIKQPPVEQLEAWASHKRFTFDNIPGYKNGVAPRLSDEKKRRRIAWAIAKWQFKTNSWKRRPWKAKPVTSFLIDFNIELQMMWAKYFEEEIANALTGN